MTIRVLTPSDREAFFKLSKAVVEVLPNKDWLIPMTKEEANVTFRDDSEDIVLGAFDGNRLVATLGLFHDIHDYSEVMPEHFLSLKGAEIGEAMVSPELRRSGLMNGLWASLKAIISKGRILKKTLKIYHLHDNCLRGESYGIGRQLGYFHKD